MMVRNIGKDLGTLILFLLTLMFGWFVFKSLKEWRECFSYLWNKRIKNLELE